MQIVYIGQLVEKFKGTIRTKNQFCSKRLLKSFATFETKVKIVQSQFQKSVVRRDHGPCDAVQQHILSMVVLRLWYRGIPTNISLRYVEIFLNPNKA